MPQRLRILTPPSMTQLLDDPVYSQYVHRRPKLPDNLKWGKPWMLVAHVAYREDNDGPVWKHRLFADYMQALDLGMDLLTRPRYDDIAVVSRRKLFQPFFNFTWEPRFAWCGRCRRPTLYRRPPRSGAPHHALKRAPVTITSASEDLYRCYYCGMRRIAQPAYRTRFK